MEWLRQKEEDVLPASAHLLQRWVLLVLSFTLLLGSNTCAGIRIPMNTNQTTSLQYVTPAPANGSQHPLIRVGLVLPATQLKKRSYQNTIREAILPFDDMLLSGVPGGSSSKYRLTYESFIKIHMSRNASPESIREAFDDFLSNNVSAIIYPTVHELFGPYTNSSQYFLQLAGNHSIPVIAWNADNSGLGQASKSGLVIQMAPSIHHQAAAMLSILVKYEWHDFTIVTTEIDGYTDFVQTIRDQVHQYGDPQDNSKQNINFTIIDHVLMSNPEECLCKINGSKVHIFLLYSTHDEALDIMKKAEELQLTGENFIWIVTESVIGDTNDESGIVANRVFPVGMLGVHFESNEDAHKRAIVASIRVFAYGFKKFLEDPMNDEEQTKALSQLRPEFYRTLKNLTIPYNQVYENSRKMGQTKHQPLEFLCNGTRKDVELKIMNIRKSPTTLSNVWEEIGTWSSLLPEVFIEGIVWPGNQTLPPSGVPEKDHSKDEDITMADITGRIVLQQCLSASLTFPGDTDQSEVLDLQVASDYIAAPMTTDSPQTDHIAEPDPSKTIPSEFSSEIGAGVVVFISFLGNASEETVNRLVERITEVRLSEDGTGKRMSVLDVQGDVLIVPQATLGGNFKDGSMQYHRNVDKAFGKVLYDKLCQRVHEVVEERTSGNVKCGVYGARQRVNMDTDGPFTHIIQV